METGIIASSKTGRHHTQQTSIRGGNLIDFIPKDEWPPSSPGLNPLDFSIWGYMLNQLRNNKYATLPEFKKVVQRIWANIPEHVVRAACDGFDKRLRLVIKPKGNLVNKMIF
jgi:hypothetical protein